MTLPIEVFQLVRQARAARIKFELKHDTPLDKYVREFAEHDAKINGAPQSMTDLEATDKRLLAHLASIGASPLINDTASYNLRVVYIALLSQSLIDEIADILDEDPTDPELIRQLT